MLQIGTHTNLSWFLPWRKFKPGSYVSFAYRWASLIMKFLSTNSDLSWGWVCHSSTGGQCPVLYWCTTLTKACGKLGKLSFQVPLQSRAQKTLSKFHYQLSLKLWLVRTSNICRVNLFGTRKNKVKRKIELLLAERDMNEPWVRGMQRNHWYIERVVGNFKLLFSTYISI